MSVAKNRLHDATRRSCACLQPCLPALNTLYCITKCTVAHTSAIQYLSHLSLTDLLKQGKKKECSVWLRNLHNTHRNQGLLMSILDIWRLKCAFPIGVIHCVTLWTVCLSLKQHAEKMRQRMQRLLEGRRQPGARNSGADYSGPTRGRTSESLLKIYHAQIFR